MGKASSMPVEKDKRMCQNFLDIKTFEFSPCLMRFGINQSTENTDSMTCLKFDLFEILLHSCFYYCWFIYSIHFASPWTTEAMMKDQTD